MVPLERAEEMRAGPADGATTTAAVLRRGRECQGLTPFHTEKDSPQRHKDAKAPGVFLNLRVFVSWWFSSFALLVKNRL